MQAPRDLLTSIPGVSWKVADIIIAETGADMTAFPTATHLCSWAGVSPGQHEYAGRRRTAPTRAGNRHLKAALCTAAMSTTRQRNTYLCAKYRRIAARRGKLRAVVAIERAILTAVWHMLSTVTYYQDPGPDYYSRHDPSKRAARAVCDLQALGYQVTVHPSPWPTKPTNSPVSYHQRGGQPDDDADYQTACQSARTVAVNGGRG